MPVTAAYISDSLANLRLSSVNDLINRLPQLENNLLSSGMDQTKAKNLLSTLKSKALTYINTQVQIATNESLIYALSGACESDTKNELLTPIIDGVPVNPASETNQIEVDAMLVSGSDAANSLQELITNAAQVFS